MYVDRIFTALNCQLGQELGQSMPSQPRKYTLIQMELWHHSQ
jgi:hypothetical protein